MTETTTPDGARVVRGTAGPLTPPSSDEPRLVAQDALRDDRAPRTLRVAQSLAGRGATHVDLEQVIAGLRVAGAYARVEVADDGAVEQIIDRLVEVGPVAPTRVTSDHALATGAGGPR